MLLSAFHTAGFFTSPHSVPEQMKSLVSVPTSLRLIVFKDTPSFDLTLNSKTF